MELWFGIGLKPGFVLGWAGTNQFPILKPALDKNSFRAVNYHNADFEAMNELLATIDWNEL